MPVFIGSSDVDPWVPYNYVKETAELFQEMGAVVEHRTYPGMTHTSNQDEIERVRNLLASRNKEKSIA
jgi:phospholipase/carboxylesterase